jgi:hypothetical protein
MSGAASGTPHPVPAPPLADELSALLAAALRRTHPAAAQCINGLASTGCVARSSAGIVFTAIV